MKKCTYCGRENEDSAAHCSRCFQDDRFESNDPAQTEVLDAQDELVTVTTCARLTDADLIASQLESAGIKTFIPDEHLMQSVGLDLNAFGYVRVQVWRKDFSNAKGLLSQAATPVAESEPSSSDGHKTIASLEVGQTGEIMERLKQKTIPAEIRTMTDENGLETAEIMVKASDYDRGCDEVEAWYAEQQENQKKKSGIYCRKCGSQNYTSTWVEKIGNIYNCKDCGNDFVR
jgi:Zn finger protein HypA/HybF involved in hydrogenase expression